jgi:hypothetical protein
VLSVVCVCTELIVVCRRAVPNSGGSRDGVSAAPRRLRGTPFRTHPRVPLLRLPQDEHRTACKHCSPDGVFCGMAMRRARARWVVTRLHVRCHIRALDEMCFQGMCGWRTISSSSIAALAYESRREWEQADPWDLLIWDLRPHSPCNQQRQSGLNSGITEVEEGVHSGAELDARWRARITLAELKCADDGGYALVLIWFLLLFDFII